MNRDHKHTHHGNNWTGNTWCFLNKSCNWSVWDFEENGSSNDKTRRKFHGFGRKWKQGGRTPAAHFRAGSAGGPQSCGARSITKIFSLFVWILSTFQIFLRPQAQESADLGFQILKDNYSHGFLIVFNTHGNNEIRLCIILTSSAAQGGGGNFAYRTL